MTITVVPIRDTPLLSDIPGQLRQMATRIESGEMEAEGAVFLIHRPGDWPDVYGWGDNLGELGMIAICELAKAWLVTQCGATRSP